MPLGFSKQYTLNNNELIISYETINEDFLFDNKLNKNYFKQVVIYNSIVIYLLRDDIETITLKLDETYRTKKSSFIELYPYFELLINDVSLKYFNEIVTYRLYDNVTYRLYDNDFVDEIFSKISN